MARISFLLGSGVSIRAGMPSVADLSNRIRAGHGVICHSNTLYGMGREQSDPRGVERARPVIDFVGELWSRAEAYFSEVLDAHTVNYEDVCSLAGQVADALSGEYESPGLHPLLRDLVVEKGGRDRLRELAGGARDYIHDLVAEMVGSAPGPVTHLKAITDACRELSRTDIYDLNHDRVIEAALDQAGIASSDGFGPKLGDVAYWGNAFDEPARHLKLHGSVRWFRYPIDTPPRRGYVIVRSETNDPEHNRDSAGEYLGYPGDGRPLILVGTHDKPLDYGRSIFADQHFRFHESLLETEVVVVSGYGFADKEINTRLIEWMLRDDRHRIVVVHPNPKELWAQSRPAAARNWAEWSRGKAGLLEARIEETSWGDIREAVDSIQAH